MSLFQLLLQSDRVTLHKSPNKSRHQDVTLVSEPSPLTEWKILHIKPKLRFEYEGVPVPVRKSLDCYHYISRLSILMLISAKKYSKTRRFTILPTFSLSGFGKNFVFRFLATFSNPQLVQ